jgi:pantothenate synthetase
MSSRNIYLSRRNGKPLCLSRALVQAACMVQRGGRGRVITEAVSDSRKEPLARVEYDPYVILLHWNPY